LTSRSFIEATLAAPVAEGLQSSSPQDTDEARQVAEQVLTSRVIKHGDGRVCLELLRPFSRHDDAVVREHSAIEVDEHVRARSHLESMGSDEIAGGVAKRDAIMQWLRSKAAGRDTERPPVGSFVQNAKAPDR